GGTLPEEVRARSRRQVEPCTPERCAPDPAIPRLRRVQWSKRARDTPRASSPRTHRGREHGASRRTRSSLPQDARPAAVRSAGSRPGAPRAWEPRRSAREETLPPETIERARLENDSWPGVYSRVTAV